MSSTKPPGHHSLPAPAILSISQSKSHVLAGVQDAYWSDEEEDAECPLCLEEMDISDLNFKPCVCGYQICRFCWHHIKENLNKRCPACRRIYTDDGIEFKPVATQDHKRLTQQKKQRERERKELETLGRKHLANVRVVQRNVAYVVGIGPRFAKEELIPTLRSNEYFGQYGKISKILIVKRTPPGGSGPVIGLYITYHRREDAARAIAAVDGAPSPGGGRDVMRASYGTTKYCMAFLRNVTCNDHNCMNLHEWGDEKDCFTKEDLTTLKHTIKTTETKAKTASAGKKDEDIGTLPRAASWGQKNSSLAASSTLSHTTIVAASGPRNTRRTAPTRQPRHSSATLASQSLAEPRSNLPRTPVERKPVASPLPASRPSTPAIIGVPRPSTPAATTTPDKPAQKKKDIVSLIRETASPAPSIATESDTGSAVPEQPIITPSRPASTDSVRSAPHEVAPPVPMVPPGLTAPPGISSPSRPPRTATDSPQTPLLASQSSYQMSNAARALLDDVKARRESTVPAAVISPFPDFDRTLQTLSENDGGFSFNLDPNLAEEGDSTDVMVTFETEGGVPFSGTFIEAFPALRPPSTLPGPPGLSYPRRPPIYNPLPSRGLGPPPIGSANYIGSFNPFSEGSEQRNLQAASPLIPLDDERKVSRFGFARGRQGTSGLSSSPLNGSGSPHLSNTPPILPPHIVESVHGTHSGWGSPRLHQQVTLPLDNGIGQVQANNNHLPRFQPFEAEVSEAQLREFIHASRERELHKALLETHNNFTPNQPFSDPAIMSASFGPQQDAMFNPMSYGPPPGLSIPSGGPPGLHLQNSGMVAQSESAVSPSAPSPAPSLSPTDFPALVSTASKETSSPVLASASLVQGKLQEKVAKKAKKAAVADKAKGVREREKAGTDGNAPDTQPQEKSQTKDLRPKTSAPSAFQQQADPPATPIVPSEIPKANKLEEKTPKKAKAKERAKAVVDNKSSKLESIIRPATPSKPPARTPKQQAADIPDSYVEAQVPILSKKPKKSKPISRPIKPLKEDTYEDGRTAPATEHTAPSSSDAVKTYSRSPSKSPIANPRATLEELLEQLTQLHPPMDLVGHSFFDVERLSSISKMPLEYGPLVHALSALSVGGGSFANNVPSGSIDTAVTSFQQLLETLTQTISDLLRLLPRTTWDDSSSFDGVLRDMLKGDDFLDEGGEVGQERDDEVAALTLALERRARWMEVQLSKLEELHRDINTAAVRAVLSFNDNGWDKEGFLPRIGDTLQTFDNLEFDIEGSNVHTLTAEELEKKLAAAKEAAGYAEVELKESMNKLQFVREFDSDFM
ncbi:hypothetical protein FA15DRAFT_663090 [Coprinopsis marcescibilis]|uniref:RING-type domain-containing protein n=1 Tax=Coprinopsis marcescibilis TaxID=230819 RepID=A0A5C3LAE1_COPMA|nr:hypothetical protein FA15DRAFT_663090 [Coprinopsis marcescibilis]